MNDLTGPREVLERPALPAFDPNQEVPFANIDDVDVEPGTDAPLDDVPPAVGRGSDGPGGPPPPRDTPAAPSPDDEPDPEQGRKVSPETGRAIGEAVMEAAEVVGEGENEFAPNEARQAVFWHLAKVGPTRQSVWEALPPEGDERRTLELLLEPDLTRAEICAQLGKSEEELAAVSGRIVNACRGLLQDLPEAEREYVPSTAAADVNEIRLSEGLSTAQLAERAGLTVSSVRRYLREVTIGTDDGVRRMLTAMNVPAGEAETILEQDALDRAEWEAAREARRARPVEASGESILPLAGELASTGQTTRLLIGRGQSAAAVRFFDAQAREANYDIARFLPPRSREALELFRQNLSDQEIRDALGLSSANVADLARSIVDVAQGMVDPADARRFSLDIRSVDRTGIGARLTEERLAAGLSLNGLAERTGLSPRTLHRMFMGESYPEAIVVERALEAMNLPAERTAELLADYEAEKVAKTGRASQSGVLAEILLLHKMQGTTRADLAAAAGVGTATIERFLYGQTLAAPEIVQAIIDRLGVTGERAEEMMARYNAGLEAVSQAAAALHDAGPALAELSARQGVSFDTLLNNAGISEPTLRRILAGTNYTSPETIESLFRSFPSLSEEEIRSYVYQYTEQREARERALNLQRSAKGSQTRRRA